MGGSPKAADYQPGETEKIQGAIAKADQDYFESTYDPLLREMRDEARSSNAQQTLRGRAQADTMQTLTGQPLAPGVNSAVDNAANMASGAIGQMLSANVAAKNVKDQEKMNVLGIARGQAADAGSALAQASKLETSERLARAAEKQTIRRANKAMLGNIANTALKTAGGEYMRKLRKGQDQVSSQTPTTGATDLADYTRGIA